MGKFLTDAHYVFTLEPYVNGTPAPTLVTKEVDMAVAAPFLLVNPDFSKTEVVKTYAHTIVTPAIDYWKQTIEDKKGDQLETYNSDDQKRSHVDYIELSMQSQFNKRAV
jgi:hypothetical protein